MNSPKLIRGEEVASILSVSRSTAFRLMLSGKIRCIRIGRCIRTTQADVIQYINSNMIGGEYDTYKNESFFLGR